MKICRLRQHASDEFHKYFSFRFEDTYTLCLICILSLFLQDDYVGTTLYVEMGKFVQ